MPDDRTRRERFDEWLIRVVVSIRASLRRLLLPGALSVLALVTLAAVGTVLRETGIPDAGFWRTGAPLTYALAIVAALAYVGYFFVILGYALKLKHSNQDRRLYTTCRDMATLVEKETNLDRADIAVHVWSVRGLRGLRRLERRATFIPHDRPPSPITWRKGKGVLGQVWLQDKWILADLEPLAEAASEEEFYAIPRDERFLFTWQEAQATAHYTAVLAWPLRGGPENAWRVIGCVSVDTQAAGGAYELENAWENERQAFNAHVAVCQAILGGA